ncbi:MAG: SRPBCC domain-containing protein [Pseudomonadota bacterium]
MSNDTSSFDLAREFPLSPEKLWTLLTDARQREAWGAPEEGMELRVEVEDLREGGLERHRCGPEDAPEFVVHTRWYRIDAPRRAVFSETVSVGGEALGTSLVTYVLTVRDGGTALGVTVAVSAFGGPEMLGEFKAGWEGGLANLERLVTRTLADTDAS